MRPMTRRKASPQRTAVDMLLRDSEGFRSAQDIYARLREQGNPIGLATVYRALQSLADDGEVDVLRTDDGEAVYRRCSTGHHHHLVCRRCGLTVEVEGGAVERWTTAVAAEHGFDEVDHVVEVFGTCGSCARRRA
jgi:Fur family transcriptional regulator, ferric uptake regulator